MSCIKKYAKRFTTTSVHKENLTPILTIRHYCIYLLCLRYTVWLSQHSGCVNSIQYIWNDVFYVQHEWRSTYRQYMTCNSLLDCVVCVCVQFDNLLTSPKQENCFNVCMWLLRSFKILIIFFGRGWSTWVQQISGQLSLGIETHLNSVCVLITWSFIMTI